MRRVARPRAEVQEERLVGVDGAQVAQELDGVIGEIRTQVIALLDGPRGPDDVVVVEQGRHELVRLTPVEAVPPVEAPAQRPCGARPRHVGLVLRREVPFAHRVGGVAMGAQDLRQVAVLSGRLAPVAREADGQVGDPPHGAAVMVPSREQARPGGRAQGGGVEVRQPHPAAGEPVEHGGVHVGSVAAELGEADVVEHHEDDVGCSLGRLRHGGPPWLRVPPIASDPAPELDSCHLAPSPLPATGASMPVGDDDGPVEGRIDRGTRGDPVPLVSCGNSVERD